MRVAPREASPRTGRKRTPVFGDQISATEAIEYSRFADWRLNPAGVPAATPDLSAARSTIDGLNREMLAQIAADWDVLHSPACFVQLDAARSEVVAAAGSTAFISKLWWRRLGRIARVNLIVSHQSVSIYFGAE